MIARDPTERPPRRRWAWLLVGTVVVFGCRRAPVLVPVEGRVMFDDGAPVTWGIVEFVPEAGGPPARSRIGRDGRFALVTGGRQGAVPGEHRVGIIQVVIAEQSPLDHRHAGPLVAPEFRSAARSGLRQRVPFGGSRPEIIVGRGQDQAAATPDPK